MPPALLEITPPVPVGRGAVPVERMGAVEIGALTATEVLWAEWSSVPWAAARPARVEMKRVLNCIFAVCFGCLVEELCGVE